MHTLNEESQAVKETPFNLIKRKLLSKIGSESFKEKQTKILKKLLLIAIIFGVLLTLFIIFDIKDRVNISINGLEAYDFSEYDEKSEVIADIKFEYNTYSPTDYFNGDGIELYNDGKRTVSICEQFQYLDIEGAFIGVELISYQRK